MRLISEILIFLMLTSCATFRVKPVKEGDQFFGKGRIYLYEENDRDYLDFIFFYDEGSLKLEGISIIGTPLFQIFISDKTYMIIHRHKSYWEGSLAELTKFFLNKEITESEILSVLSKKNSSSLEIKEFFKNSNFPKEICWKEGKVEGRIKIKWVKRSTGLNLNSSIPPHFRKISLEEISL